MQKRIFLAAGVLAVSALAAPAVWAQGAAAGYPARSIRIIAPFPPGATLDMLSRLVAQKLGEDWGVSVIVENRAGGGGVIGTDAAAKATPDGYTFATVPNSFAVNPTLRNDLPYDTARDFTPVTLLGSTPHILVVNPALPANTVQELVALAKQQPGKLSYASFGNGSTPHLAGEMLKMMAGIDIIHVPYRGQVPALTDLMG
ncbi:MAG: tripartite tricarboxylate transporter substrate-binding protein, partial [Burkholderiaceae bacterium]|nr:tripartite tricarboxylate transporter substrate-binding protein [Burkholderiaceae bacterium]